MDPLITNPDKFASQLNAVTPGINLTTQDVLEMTECDLMGHYRYYCRQNLQVVRAVLKYIDLRQKSKKSYGYYSDRPP